MRRGLAIVNMLIFVVIFSFLAATMLSLASSSTRQIESNIRRIRGFCAAESAYVMAINRMRTGLALGGPYAIPWGVDDASGAVVATMQVNISNGWSVPCSTASVNCLNATSGYAAAW